uniref:Reverse transcriptase zinc-binding domain-containing protein n=1 Tax=Cuerna arida TaxID=1464854 RepID=A0A1B6GBE9_9HEMI
MPIYIKLGIMEAQIERKKGLVQETKGETKIRYENNWNQEWQESTKGRYTHEIFNSVQDRMRCAYIKHYVVQILYGHGANKAYLLKHDKVEVELCTCGLIDPPVHALLKCEEHNEERQRLIRKQKIATSSGLKGLIEQRITCQEIQILVKKFLTIRDI